MGKNFKILLKQWFLMLGGLLESHRSFCKIPTPGVILPRKSTVTGIKKNKKKNLPGNSSMKSRVENH